MSSYKSTVLIECTNIILLFRLPLNFGQLLFKVWIDIINEASHYLIKLTPTQHTYGKIIITTTIIYVFLYCSLFSIALFSLLLTFLYCFFFSCSLFSMVGYTWNQPYKGFNQLIKCIKSLIYLYFGYASIPINLTFSAWFFSLPLYISPSTFLFLSLLLSIILFGVSNGRFRPCFVIMLYLFFPLISE